MITMNCPLADVIDRPGSRKPPEEMIDEEFELPLVVLNIRAMIEMAAATVISPATAIQIIFRRFRSGARTVGGAERRSRIPACGRALRRRDFVASGVFTSVSSPPSATSGCDNNF